MLENAIITCIPTLTIMKYSTDLWRCCWYLSVSLNVHACVWGCVVVCVSGTAPLCPTQSIPLHSTRPHQNKQLHQAPKMRTRLSTVAGSPKKPPQTFWGCISDLVSQMILYIHSCTCQTPNTLIFSTGFSSQRSVAKVKPSTVLWHHQQRVQ